jgi:TonB family protein
MRWVVLSTILVLHPARGGDKPKTADDFVARARTRISAGRLDAARGDLDSAIQRIPGHADAHFLLCGVAVAQAEGFLRGYGSQEKVDYELYDAGKVCATSIEHNTDPDRRASLLASRLRTQIAGRRWSEAAETFHSLSEDSPDDGRLVGGYAAMLDRAGRKAEGAAALRGASEHGADFERAARFEYVWDRYERVSPQPLAPMIAELRKNEDDRRRIAVLDLLQRAENVDESVALPFLEVEESNVLTPPELEKLWTCVAGPAPRDGKGWGDVKREPVPSTELPQLQNKVEPRYPPDQREQRKEGRVELLTRVGSDGAVEAIWIMRSSGPSFSDAAIAAVRNWRYAPGTKNGEPVVASNIVRVDFRIR